MDFAKRMKTGHHDDLLLVEPKALKADIIKYIMELKAKNLSFSTRNRTLASIRHFCSMNELELNWQLIFKFLGEREPTNEDRGYTHEEISKLLVVADRKWKAIIYLMCSSGLRVGAIADLKYGDLSTMQIEGHNIFKVTIYRNTTSEHYSFCTPEAYNSITEYLDYRERCGEVLTDDSPLFRIDFDPKDLEQIQNPKTMKYKTFKNKVRDLSIRAGITANSGNIKNRNQVQANHAFRKFFASQLENADVGDFHIEALLGHITGLRGTYRKTPEKRLMEYVKAIDMLTINEENRLKLMVKTLSQEKDQKIRVLEEQMAAQGEMLKMLNERQRQNEEFHYLSSVRGLRDMKDQKSREVEELAIKWLNANATDAGKKELDEILKDKSNEDKQKALGK